MSLEDEAGDVLRKARVGQGLSLANAARISGLSETDLRAAEALDAPVTEAFLPLASHLGLDGAALLAMDPAKDEVTPLPQAVRRLKTPWGSWTYLVFSPRGALVIDPAVPPALVRKTAEGIPLVGVLLTHAHPDHVATLDAFGDLPRYGHPSLGASLGTTAPPEAGVWGFTALPAPGHASEGLAFYGYGMVFTGDALFARSAGGARSEADYPDVLASVGRLLALPPETVVLPGHGEVTTIATERALNPFRGVRP